MTKNNALVSIIIPCYNAQNYISKTLDSVFNQTFSNFELVCVNDGSTDNTLEILEDYAKKHSNMKVITKENEGGKNVTKTGLLYISGKYVCVIDNDDIIDKKYVEELYRSITENDADIAVCGFQREDFDTKKVYSKEMIRKDSTVDLEENFGEALEVNTSMWNKMFKKEVIVSLNDFRLDSRGLGDMVQLLYLYAKVNKIAFNGNILYYYQVRKNSDINSMKKDVIDNIYDNLIRIRKYYEEVAPERLEFLDAYAFLHLGVSLMYRIYRNSSRDFKEVYKKNVECLNKNFPTWKSNKYYNLRYILTHKLKNLKLHICHLFYKVHLFKFFIKTYNFFTDKLGFDIKW